MLKLIFGSAPREERRREYEQGLLDNYPVHQWDDLADGKRDPKVKVVKMSDLRNRITHCLATQLYNLIDLDEFVTKEIETKGIVVIDEIDKLA
jgi:ATP-dependent protease HslVU (ClpYQ) ATPase subunit